MIYRLIIVTGPMTGQRVTVPEIPLAIGRDPDCGFCIRDPDVGRRHAVLSLDKDGLRIRDMGTMNRIIVNGREVPESRLKHGDEVEIGRTRFVVQAVVEADVADRQSPAKRRRGRRAMALAAVAIALAAAAYWRWGNAPAPAPTIVPEPPAFAPAQPVLPPDGTTLTAMVPIRAETVTAAAPIVAVSPGRSEEVSEEIRRLTLDLVALRTTVQMIAETSLSSRVVRVEAAPAPPVVVTATVPSTAVMVSSTGAVTVTRTGPPAAATVPAAVQIRQEVKPAAASFRGKIAIASLDQRKFPASQDVDEMRVLDIGLAADPPEARPDVGLVRVQVMVFDRNSATGIPFLTRAIVRNPQFTASGEWQTNAVNVASATYVVPKGGRSGGGEPVAGVDEFYGYVVRVYYDGEFQSEQSRPRDLAGYAPAPQAPALRAGEPAGSSGGSKGHP